MSTYDDPNREAVGLDPIWTGAEDEAPPPEPDPAPEKAKTSKKAETKDDD